MNKLLSLAIILTFFYILLSCSTSTSPIHSDDNFEVLYFNSFESSNDTIGWNGSIVFSNETPSGKGKRSLYVSGSCLVPHVYFLFGPLNEDCSIMIRFWGKNLMIGGIVELSRMDNSQQEIYIEIDKKTWYKYASLDTLDCLASDTLMLSFISGGFLPSAMLIDDLEILKVIN